MQNSSHAQNSPTTTPPSVSKVKSSKYAPFMRAMRVRTPKYKFYVEMGRPQGRSDAPVILLISGLGAQFLMWPDAFCKALIDAGFAVVRFDNRDIGKSSKIKKKRQKYPVPTTRLERLSIMSRFKLGLSNKRNKVPYTLFDMAEDTHQILRALEIDKAYVIGSSMGGMIAQILAAKHPTKVLGLGLLSTSSNKPLSTPPFPKQIMSLMGRPDEASEDELVANLVKTFKAIGSPDYFDAAVAEENARRIVSRRFYPKGVMRQLLAVFATGSLTVTNRMINCPTIVVHGSKDKVFLPAHGKSLAKSIKHAKFELIEGMGHDIPPVLQSRLARVFSNHFLRLPQDTKLVLNELPM